MDATALMTEPALCERLWREHADRLLLYASALLGDRAAAEDALQAVFARLAGASELPDLDSPGAYLHRAVRNESLNARRSTALDLRARRNLFDPDPADPRDEAEVAELRSRVERFLGELPVEQREAVVLKIWSGLSFPEAADVLGVSPKTVEHRYYRGLAALEEKLGPEI